MSAQIVSRRENHRSANGENGMPNAEGKLNLGRLNKKTNHVSYLYDGVQKHGQGLLRKKV